MGPVRALRVATYNIRKAIGRDAQRDPRRILSLVADFGADVVALQEADYRFKRRQALFDPLEVHAMTGLRPVPIEHDQNGLGWHGNVLLVAADIVVDETEAIELPGLEPRGAVRADLSLDGVRLRVVAAHLGLLASYRRRQAEALLAVADPVSDHATIVMGDFNGWGKARYSLKPFGAAMREAACGHTYPSGRPLTRLDRIYYAGPLMLEDCTVIRTGVSRIASDHLPVRASFKMLETTDLACGPLADSLACD